MRQTPAPPAGMTPRARADRDAPRLLVLRALGLGDFLTIVPALHALADAFPAHRRVLAAPRWLTPLALLSGAVHELVDTAPLAALDPAHDAPDVAVNLHGRGPESHRVLLALRPRRLVAFAHPAVAASAGGPAWRPREHEVHRWCRLLAGSGIPADPSRLELPLPRPSAPSRPGDDDPSVAPGATLLHPGAASGARRWPADRWAAVARAERAAGRRVIITGSREERPLALAIAATAAVPDHAVLAGRTSVIGLARLVAAAGRVVCGDTGVAHLATALGTPSVVLFGPTPPAEWGPPADRPQHRVLWAGRPGDPHGALAGAGLLDIGVAEVLGALR